MTPDIPGIETDTPARPLTTTCCVGFNQTGRPDTDTDTAVVTGTIPETPTFAPAMNHTGNPVTETEACVVTGAIDSRLTVPVVVPAIVTVTVVGLAIQTTAPVAETLGCAVVLYKGWTVTAPVTLTTVVPAPAVTVPVITTGNAVLLCPPAIHITWPTAATDGAPAVVFKFNTVTVPETAGMTEMLTAPVTRALTLKPTAIVLTD